MSKPANYHFSPDFMSDFKGKVPILDVVESHTHLIPKGNVYFGLCPFHEEKTGSLSVNPDAGLFHCFGCGAGGDVISFVQEIEGLSFLDAVTCLSDRYRIELPYDDNNSNKLYRTSNASGRITPNTSLDTPISTLYRLLDAAKGFYCNHLSEEVTGYLIGRGVKPDILTSFAVGFSPNDTGVIDHLGKLGFDNEIMIEAGVCYRDSYGSLKDRMAGRIVFPLCDPSGRVIAFAGRANPLAPHDQEVKYLNTPNTRVYQKNARLYGLDFAKKLAVPQMRMCVTEGYLDVLTLASHDFPAVAICGTAFSAEHVRLIKRFLHGSGDYQAILLFDSDTAGTKANSKALETILDSDQSFLAHLKVASLQDGDPAEAIARDVCEIDNALTSSLAIIPWQVKKIISGFNVFRADQRMEAALQISELLGKIDDGYTRKSYAHDLAWTLNIPEDTIYELVAKQHRNRLNRQKYAAEKRTLKESKPILEDDMNMTTNIKTKVEVEELFHENTLLHKLNTLETKNARVAFEKIITILVLKYPHQAGKDYDAIIELSYPLFQDIKMRINTLGGAESYSPQKYRHQEDWLTAITDIPGNTTISIDFLRALITSPNPCDIDKYEVPGFIKKMALGFSCQELIKEKELELRGCDPFNKEECYDEIIEDLESLKICLEDARSFVRKVNNDFLEQQKKNNQQLT